MKLKRLLKDIPNIQIKGSKDPDITGVCANSHLVAPGNLFIARRGLSSDGTHYIPEAVEAGAVAVLTDIYDPLLSKSVTQILHSDVASLEGVIAAQYYQYAGNEMFMIGITGTNGKTTTSFLIKHLLDSFHGPCGLIGTIEYIIGQHRYQATRTTPDAVSTQKMLREMVIQGCRSAVMEVTSHALDQHRVDCISFDTAVFTNLSLDHMDYHKTIENYVSAKNKLFRSLNPKSSKKNHSFPKMAVVNADSPLHEKILEGCLANKITYAIDKDADLKAENVELSSNGTKMTLCYQGKKIDLSWSLVGRFNIYNCLATVAVGLSRQIPLEKIVGILEKAPFIPGRLQVITNPLDLKIYVDFAHTDDALANVLECLQEFKTGRIITVFGCGGNRDASKRPRMAKVCQQYADLTIVTSDNPRNEDPADIIRQIVSGFSTSEKYIVEMDRYEAIEKAIVMAINGDIILIAGKGHETHQIFAHKTVEFDDRNVALEICQKIFDSAKQPQLIN